MYECARVSACVYECARERERACVCLRTGVECAPMIEKKKKKIDGPFWAGFEFEFGGVEKPLLVPESVLKRSLR